MVHSSRTITATKNLLNTFEKAAGCSFILQPFSFLGWLPDIVFHVKQPSSALTYRTEGMPNGSLSSVLLSGTKTVLDVRPEGTRPAEVLHANPFEIKPGNVTDKRYASHQRNMAMLQAPLVTNRTSVHPFLVRLSEQVKSPKAFPKKQYSLNQITTEQESSHTSGK